MKIYACIPSFNEAQNIKAITKVVDAGLQRFKQAHPNVVVHIVNADSASTDNTPAVFEATPTRSKKTCIKNTIRGKGVNLFGFIDFALQAGADYYVTIDADVTSADPDWISKLLAPLIAGEADFSTPLYERDRYDGRITLHFAYPTMLAFTGQSVRQPIGGDFAFTRKVAALVQRTEKPAAAMEYGVDIFLTLISALHGLAIAQVPLGQKLHASGLGKLEGMFQQVAATAAFVLRTHSPTRPVRAGATMHIGITAETPPLTTKDRLALYLKLKDQFAAPPSWLPELAAR